MFGLSPATKIYIAVEGVDMRKGFDGLYGLVRDRLGQDPLSGHLFLFSNRARSRLKARKEAKTAAKRADSRWPDGNRKGNGNSQFINQIGFYENTRLWLTSKPRCCSSWVILR